MSYRSYSSLKLIIGTFLLLGVLGVSLLSLAVMEHGTSAQHGCLGLGSAMSSCEVMFDIVSCLQIHLGILHSVSQITPTSVSQLLVAVAIVIVLWFGLKRKRGEPDVLSRLRLRWQGLTTSPHVLSEEIERWLTLHEKRDPAPATLMVPWVLPVIII